MGFGKDFNVIVPTPERRGKIMLTVSTKYISLSKEGCKKLNLADNDGYVQLANKLDEKRKLYMGACKKSDEGAIQLFDTKRNTPKKSMAIQNIDAVAQLLKLDLGKGTYRVPGTYNEKLECLVFEGRHANLVAKEK